MKGEGGLLGFLYDVNLPARPAPRPPTDLPPSQVFHGIGVASLHTNLLDGREDVHFLFKSSPFGSRSHGHNPQNSFLLNAYGEPLLMTCVYRDLHGSRFHYEWAHSTVAHNAVLVEGLGQKKHSAESLGRIVAEQLTPAFDYIAGDATAAYEGRLSRGLRHVAFVKNVPTPFVVLCDELEASTPGPHAYQFLLHALQPFLIDADTSTLRTARPGAGLQAKFLSPGPISFRQWEGYDPPPTQAFPNQWHAEATAQAEGPRLEMLTVLVPHRGDRPPSLKAERLDTPDAVGVTLTIDGQSTSVAFRRAGVHGPARWQGASWDGPLYLRSLPR